MIIKFMFGYFISSLRLNEILNTSSLGGLVSAVASTLIRPLIVKKESC